jgi:septin family protein
MDTNDLMTIKALSESNSMSPYEQYKVGHMQAKSHTSGIGVAGLVLGTVGTAAAIGAWIFAPLYGNAKASQAKEVAVAAKEIANVQIAASQRQLDQLTALFAAERQERINGDITLNATINDTVSGSQQGQLSASQVATNEATAQIMAGVMTGKYSESPQKVELLTPAKPFQCGCGCGEG